MSLRVKWVMKAVAYGALASSLLLVVYFSVLTLISGWAFAQSQFNDFWYYVVSLAVGFGIQVGLYTYLKALIKRERGSGKVLGAAGATSTAAMISCCLHYLTNVLALLGVAGLVSLVAQYQVELFWVGLGFNLLGILYIGSKIVRYQRRGRLFWSHRAITNGIWLSTVVVVAVSFLIVSAQERAVSPAVSVPAGADQPAAKAGEKRSDSQAEVTVTATPLDLSAQAKIWRFELVLSTHTVELSQDLIASARLLDEQGREYQPISWKGSPPGGHHREGVLSFTAVAPRPEVIRLRLVGVGGVTRYFAW